eukprot:TRINITY_DN1033_c0_g2_i1.p1 TRINITY_DN1033_c0_g2~~TRINITY_DN1033_c0_g2_i1.p1  ORF type:complete len:196 (-),score=52.18 TRINITY_DN1033_c0_g2_i1:259-846(-)
MPSCYDVVVLGTANVGKSCLVIRFIRGKFVEDYDPTIEDSYRHCMTVDERECVIDVLDTAGCEEYEDMRNIYLKKGQGFVFIFSITNKESFEGAQSLIERMKELKNVQKDPHHYFRMIIVGNKCDLENDRVVTSQEGTALGEKHSCPYYETSAKTGENVDIIFIELVRLVRQFADSIEKRKMGQTKANSSKCFIL